MIAAGVDTIIDSNTYNNLPFVDFAERILEPAMAKLIQVSGKAEGDVHIRITVQNSLPWMYEDPTYQEELEDGA